MNFFAERATRELIADATPSRRRITRRRCCATPRRRAARSTRIDRCPIWSASSVPEDPPPSDAAFLVWRQTALAPAAHVGGGALRPRWQAGQPLPLEHPRIHRGRRPEQRRLRLGRLRRSRAVRLRGAAHAARRARRLHDRRPGVRAQQGAVILHVVFDYRRCPSSRRRVPTSRSSGRRAPPPKKAPPAATSRSRSMAGACHRSTRRARGLADHRRSVHADLRLARAVLDGRPPRRTSTARLFLQRSRRHLRARLSASSRLRSPRAPGGADDARAAASCSC